MSIILKELFIYFSKKDKYKFVALIILVFFTTIFEIIGLALILPFLILIGNLNIIETNVYINSLYIFSGFSDHYQFLYSIAITAITMIFLGTLLAIYTNFKLLSFSTNIGNEFSKDIFKYFLNNHNNFKLSEKEILKKILTDSIKVGNSIIFPCINIISKSLLVFFLFIVLLIVEYKVALAILVFLCLFYIVTFMLSIKKTNNNTLNIDKLKKEKVKIVTKSFDNIDNLSIKIKNEKVRDYYIKSSFLSKRQSMNTILNKIPKYIMTFLVFMSIVSITTYIVSLENINIHMLMTKILIFVILGFKSLPQIQTVYVNYLKLKSNIDSFENIKDILSEIYKENNEKC